MKIKKKCQFIEIKTKNLSKYTDIALLVDKPYFTSEIEAVRKKYKELDFLYPLSKEDSKKAGKFHDKMLYEDRALEKRFKTDVERIRKLFKKPPHFRDVIMQSIIYGAVYESGYSKAYLEKQEITPANTPHDIPDVKYCIVVHSGTTFEDIKKVFREFKKEVWVNFKASEEEKRKYNFGYWFDFSLNRPFDTKDSIKELSNFYRLRKNGISPLGIALKDLKISKRQYKDALQKLNVQKQQDEEYDRNLRLVNKVEQRRDVLKSLIRRYSRLLSTPDSIL